jgi:hypothetical protein
VQVQVQSTHLSPSSIPPRWHSRATSPLSIHIHSRAPQQAHRSPSFGSLTSSARRERGKQSQLKWTRRVGYRQTVFYAASGELVERPGGDRQQLTRVDDSSCPALTHVLHVCITSQRITSRRPRVRLPSPHHHQRKIPPPVSKVSHTTADSPSRPAPHSRSGERGSERGQDRSGQGYSRCCGRIAKVV